MFAPLLKLVLALIFAMNYKKWLSKNTESLCGKRVAVTGATGGLGAELCRFLAELGAELLLLNRSEEKTETLINELKAEYKNLKAEFIPLELEDKISVEKAARELQKNCPDVIIHNAGAYSIPRRKTNFGFNNIFVINYLAPLYMTELLWNELSEKSARVVVVGSIAHNYSKTNADNIDFSGVRADSKVYGNAKRHLMLSMYEKFQNEKDITLSVVHPGITFTNITAHYPKWIFAIIKNPMKIIFMKPRKAALCIVKGIFSECKYGEWIGPRLFGIWGLPKKASLKTFNKQEAKAVYLKSQKILGANIRSHE